MSDATVDTIVHWLLLGTLPAVNLYVLVYAFRPWRRTEQGRALMVMASGTLIVLDVLFAYVWFGDYPFRNYIRVTGFSLFFAGNWYLLVTLLRVPGARDYPPFRWRRHVR